jgi:hypothetical protein
VAGFWKAMSAAVRERIGTRPENAGARQVPLARPIEAPNQPMKDTNGWFGPGQPPDPTAPPDVAGRRLDYIPGVNMLQQPRQYEAVGFDDLRALADNHDLLRIIIETRKDQISRLTWAIVPKDDDVELEGDLAARAKKYTDLFMRPDRDQFWGDWIRTVLEDLLVIDAPAIHVRRTLGGEVYSLDQVDGATIKRVIDEWGRIPEPPFCAYQQVLKGMNAVNYSRLDLVYRPRNMRVHKLYGFSPVEQIIMTVNIALRRQMWQLAYFTDGNIPDSLIGVPSTWTPDQIKQFQDWFDSMLQGNLQGRRSAKFVPGEVAKSYVPTKEAEIFGHAEEWLARVICFCFGVSHQALVKEVNKATAQTAMDQAKEDGMAPIMNWIKGLHDSILIDQFGETELEFKWNDDKEMDPKVLSDIHNQQLGKLKTINEIREELGLEPDPSPLANLLGSFAVDGSFVPIDPNEQIKLKQQMIEAFTGMGLQPDGSVAPPPPQPGEEEDDPNNTPPGKGGKQPKPKPGKDSAQSGGSGAGGKDGGGSAEKSSSTTLQKAAVPNTSPLRPKARRIRRSLQKSVATVLGDVLESVTEQVARALESHGVRKADDEQIIDAVMAALNLDGLDALIDASYADLLAIAEDTSRTVLAQLGVSDNKELVDRVNQRAVEYARERSAELVGKRVLADGSIIDNPDAKWAIDETTRTMIRDTIAGGLEDNIGSDAIIEALESSYAFSPARAEMVSRTEIAMANSDSAMSSMREAADAGVNLQKAWILGPEPCEVCQDNAAAGNIDLDETFPSGDDTVPAHPNCECAVVAIAVDEETGAETEEGEE